MLKAAQLDRNSSPIFSPPAKSSTPHAYATRSQSNRTPFAILENTPTAKHVSLAPPLRTLPASPESYLRTPQTDESTNTSFADTPDTSKRRSSGRQNAAKKQKSAVIVPGTDQSPRFIAHANEEGIRPIESESPTVAPSGFPTSVYTPGGTRLVLRTSLKSLATYGEEPLPAPVERPQQSGDHETEVLSATVRLTPEYIHQLSRDRVRSPSQQQAVAHEFSDREEAVASEHAKRAGIYQEGDTWQWLHLIAFMLLRNEAQQSGNLAAGLRGSNFNMLPIERMALEFAKNFAEVNLTVNALLAPGTRVAQEFEYRIQIPGQAKLRFVIPAFDRKSDRTLRPAFRAMTKYYLQKAEEETSLSQDISETASLEAQERYLENLLDIVVQKTQAKDYSLREEPSSPTTYRQEPGKELMPAMVSSSMAADTQPAPPGKLGLRRIPMPKFSLPPKPEVGPSVLTTSQVPNVAAHRGSFSPDSPASPLGVCRSRFFGVGPVAKLVFEDPKPEIADPKDVPKAITMINCA